MAYSRAASKQDKTSVKNFCRNELSAHLSSKFGPIFLHVVRLRVPDVGHYLSRLDPLVGLGWSDPNVLGLLLALCVADRLWVRVVLK